MKRKCSLILTGVLLCAVLAACHDYGDTMREAFKSAFGSDYKEYEFVSYPTDNFGIGTSYLQSADPKNFQCATWSCFGYSAAQVQEIIKDHPDRLFDVDGHADIGMGGSLNLSTDQQNTMAVSAVVPSIYNMLSVTADVNWSKHVKTTISMPKGHIRFINADSFAAYMNKLPTDNPRRQALVKGNLIVIWSDLVADSMTVTIDIDRTADADLDAKLSNALVGKAGTIIGQNADLSFKVTSAVSGHYELQTLFPVVAAVLAAKPPVSRGGPAEPIKKPDFKRWEKVKLPENLLGSSSTSR
jgi:hypothetical protein